MPIGLLMPFDTNGNGFIERGELEVVRKPTVHRSVRSRLLPSCSPIGKRFPLKCTRVLLGPMDGISRLDLDAYFKLLLASMS
ncbi:MAG: hypothetical protein IPM93_18260 [Candidatus Obscuribacter sp.]|nr:hypothetical protein [Candidatus Obscuribacter sp.]